MTEFVVPKFVKEKGIPLPENVTVHGHPMQRIPTQPDDLDDWIYSRLNKLESPKKRERPDEVLFEASKFSDKLVDQKSRDRAYKKVKRATEKLMLELKNEKKEAFFIVKYVKTTNGPLGYKVIRTF